MQISMDTLMAAARAETEALIYYADAAHQYRLAYCQRQVLMRTIRQNVSVMNAGTSPEFLETITRVEADLTLAHDLARDFIDRDTGGLG